MNDKQRTKNHEQRPTNRKKSLFRSREWPVYRDAKSFRKKIRKLANRLPENEKYLLKDQISRSADSICLNIAEGSNKLSDIDFSRYLNNSETSLEEVVCCMDLILDGHITEDEFVEYLKEAARLGAQLIALERKSVVKEPVFKVQKETTNDEQRTMDNKIQ
jgi:four helix bundle protein